MRAVWHRLLWLCLGLSGCGSLDPKDTSDRGEAVTGNLFPWAAGNSWTYRVTKDGEVSDKVTTIGERERVGGIGPNQDELAFKVVTKKGPTDETISWQIDLGDKIVRYREQAYHANAPGELELEEHWAPYKLRIDKTPERTRLDASWLVVYDETKLPVGAEPTTATARDRWSVISESESVTVPAGTFDALVVQKVGGESVKLYWFVPGIGKVKEAGGQTEELVSYEVEP